MKFLKYSFFIILTLIILLIGFIYYMESNMAMASKPTTYSNMVGIEKMSPPPMLKRAPASIEDDIENIQEQILMGGDIDLLTESTAAGSPQPQTPIDFTQQLKTANMGFTINDKANIDDYVLAKFTITTTKTIKEIRKELENMGIMITDSIEISKLVMVDIKAPDFEVTAVSPNKQPIRANGDTNWKWKLKPKAEGSYPVELAVYAQVMIDGVEQSTFIQSYDETVIVNITGKQKIERWWENNWEWAWSTLIIPIGLFFRDKIINIFKREIK